MILYTEERACVYVSKVGQSGILVWVVLLLLSNPYSGPLGVVPSPHYSWLRRVSPPPLSLIPRCAAASSAASVSL